MRTKRARQDRVRQGDARRGKVRQDSHARVSELVPVVSQHVPSQHHSRRPRLASTSRGEVFVDLQWRLKQAAEVYSRVAGRLVLREGRKVDAKRGRVQLWRGRTGELHRGLVEDWEGVGLVM